MVGMTHGRRVRGCRLLQRSQNRLQSRAVDIGHLAQLTNEMRQIWCGCLGLLGRGLLKCGVRRWGSVGLRGVSVLRLWRIGWLLCDRPFCSLNQLGRNWRVQVLVLVEPDVATGRPVEYLQRDLCCVLSSHVQLHHAMNTLQDLSLNDRVSGEARVEKQGVRLQATLPEASLHPVDEVIVDLLHEQDLHIRYVVSISTRNVELIRFLTTASIRARASAPISVLSLVGFRRSRSLSVVCILMAPVPIVGVVSSAMIFASR